MDDFSVIDTDDSLCVDLSNVNDEVKYNSVDDELLIVIIDGLLDDHELDYYKSLIHDDVWKQILDEYSRKPSDYKNPYIAYITGRSNRHPSK